MKCKLCGNSDIEVTYKGIIRDGKIGHYTDKEITMYKCRNCDVIWHESYLNLENYYESEEYRQSLEGTSEEDDFYKLHDKESLDKFKYTGTTIFRGKTVADIGCGAGAFLDYINGVADKVVAIEPSLKYRTIMKKKGFETFKYASDAQKVYENKLDVITSFDVIEHVEDPQRFVCDYFELLKNGGTGIIGTPTEAPVMRKLLGSVYEKKQLFSTQHLWVLAEKNLRLLAKNAGFKNIEVKYFQRYGIGNMMGWLREKESRSEIDETFITETLDNVWKNQLSGMGMADYIVLYVKK